MIAKHSALVSTRAPVIARVLEDATGSFFLGAVGSFKYLSTGLKLFCCSLPPVVREGVADTPGTNWGSQ